MFGDVKEVYWLSKIFLSQEREENVSEYFNKHVDFKYTKSIEDFNLCLNFFKERKNKTNCSDNFMGETTLLDKLIVMDDVSGLAHKSEEFAKFLTVSRKFGFICVYIFHTTYLTRSNWRMILLQKNFFNIFPGSTQTLSVIKISSYCNRYMYDYIPHRDLRLNWLYFDILNSNKKQYLTIDAKDVNNLGSAKLRTRAGNNNEQVYYYNQHKKRKKV